MRFTEFSKPEKTIKECASVGATASGSVAAVNGGFGQSIFMRPAQKRKTKKRTK